MSDPSLTKSAVYWSWNKDSASFENQLSQEASDAEKARKVCEVPLFQKSAISLVLSFSRSPGFSRFLQVPLVNFSCKNLLLICLDFLSAICFIYFFFFSEFFIYAIGLFFSSEFFDMKFRYDLGKCYSLLVHLYLRIGNQ